MEPTKTIKEQELELLKKAITDSDSKDLILTDENLYNIALMRWAYYRYLMVIENDKTVHAKYREQFKKWTSIVELLRTPSTDNITYLLNDAKIIADAVKGTKSTQK